MNTGQVRLAMSEFDGRATTVLTEIEAKYSKEAGYVDALIDLIDDANAHLSEGSTWLLKAKLDKNETLSDKQTSNFLSALPTVSSWQAQLHICQSIRHLSIGLTEASTLIKWLQALMKHRRPFLRAWSVDAIIAVAQQHNQYADLARNALEHALGDDAASVRARARSLSKMFAA